VSLHSPCRCTCVAEDSSRLPDHQGSYGLPFWWPIEKRNTQRRIGILIAC
jgi:hypothetical protein